MSEIENELYNFKKLLKDDNVLIHRKKNFPNLI